MAISKNMDDDYEEIEDRGDVYIQDEEEELDEEEEVLEEEEGDEEEVEEDEEDSEEPEEDDDESEDEEDDGTEEEEEDEEEARIPRSRLNQVIEQREALKEQVDFMRDQMEQMIALQKMNQKVEETPKVERPEKFDFRKAGKEAAEALLEGDTDKYAEIQDQIEAARQLEMDFAIKAAKEEATKEASNKATGTLEDDRFDKVLSTALDTYDFLDDESDNYNGDAVEIINAAMAGHIANGMPKSKALDKAVKALAPMFAPPKEKKETLGNKRTKAARKKAAKASQQQPPVTKRAAKGKAKRDLDVLDISKMSDTEYSKLSLRERKALRGD